MKQRVADLGIDAAAGLAAWERGLAALIVVFGVLGLLDGSWPDPILGLRGSLHALFGLLLCTLIALRFHGHSIRRRSARQADIGELSRDLSRMVYLFLYVIIGLRQIMGFAILLCRGGTGNFAADGDLQTVVACGVGGLLLIRGLAFAIRLHEARSVSVMIDVATMANAPDRNFDELPRSHP